MAAGEFVLGTSLPLLLSGVICVAALYPLRHSSGGRAPPVGKGGLLPAAYLLMVVSVVFSSDFLGVSSVAALGASFFLGLLLNIRSLRTFPKEFDLRSLLILYFLVTGVAVLAALAGPSVGAYAAEAASGVQPFSALFVGAVSNIISNVPATQLLLSAAHISPSMAPRIAVEAGLAGNIDPIGSFANLLALMLVRRAGLPVGRAIALQLAVGLLSFLPAFM